MKDKLEGDVRKAQMGDKIAFTRLIGSLESYLYRISTSIMGSDQEGLDATQEALIKAYISLPNLKEPKYFKTWITRILIRECARMKRNQRKIISMQEVIDNKNQNNVDNLELKEAINALEDECRIVILLYYIQDLPLKEVAEILEQPEGTIKSRLSRARKKLAGYLGKENHIGGILNEQI
ncbi:sigma-70 family RNA polymerase sigma factor [Bacillus sp. CGMCC 1.16607]|uniref:sigma-70 family RNA polymerase sigma factor n=1 Tax=Bacillus sp. CGMCC 1.16607 TaxID=3351842 RepID=UPI0036326C57